ncbi:MAG: nickel pincer cofactor biosynthesis protein LarC [Phycisphaerae bacterium]
MIAYFDCTNGVAGDMVVAGLLDAGASWTEFLQQIAALNIEGYNLDLTEVSRAGIKAKLFQVNLDHHHHSHRDLNSIIELIQGSKLHDRVISRAVKIFTKLAQVEAEIHNCEISNVHFHEVGAVDAIIDIVGACICLELLNVDEIYYSKIAVGGGQVKNAHGILPVPAPATAKLLLDKQIYSGDRTGELATPTGAAIMVTLGTQKVDLPELTLKSIGYGAGSRDDPNYPNTVRVLLGRQDSQDLQTDEVTIISFNVDDITGEHLGWLAEQIMGKGALDVAQIPVFMKKSRSATLVQVLSPAEKVDELVEFILTQSTTFGVRLGKEKRYKLNREFVVAVLPEGKVRVKLGYFNKKLVQVSPEFEDCRKITERTGINFRKIYARAAELARQEMEDRHPEENI